MFALIFPSATAQKRQSLMTCLLFLAAARESDPDALLDDFERQSLQRQAGAGPPDALAGRRLEDRAVIGAHQVAVIDGKKLIIDPIQTDADMGATVDVGVM